MTSTPTPLLADHDWGPQHETQPVYVRDGDGDIHLADPTDDGYISGCTLRGDVTEVDPVPDDILCSECLADRLAL